MVTAAGSEPSPKQLAVILLFAGSISAAPFLHACTHYLLLQQMQQAVLFFGSAWHSNI